MQEFIREPAWISARVGDQLVMMSVETDVYIGLTDVGTRIWELLEKDRTVDALCDRLTAEFDVEPATCRAEIDQFLEELVRIGAVRTEEV